MLQGLFGNYTASNIAILMALHVRPLAKAIIKRTHGDYF
jgi:hypothetical protein